MTTQPTPKGAWKITFLLFLFMLVNFADKIVVGLGGAPDHGRIETAAGTVRSARLLVLLPVSISAIVVGFIVNSGSRPAGFCL